MIRCEGEVVEIKGHDSDTSHELIMLISGMILVLRKLGKDDEWILKRFSSSIVAAFDVVDKAQFIIEGGVQKP